MKKSRLALIGLFALFLAPFFLALLFHAGVGSWFERGTVNRGSLIEPPRPAPPGALPLAQGGELEAARLDRHWTLIYVAGDGCGDACAEALKTMRQTHLALGRHRDRVQRFLFLPSGASPEAGAAACECEVVRLTAAWRAFLSVESGGALTQGGLFVLDPRRFLVLHFPPDVAPRALKSDLDRLLRYSRWQTG